MGGSTAGAQSPPLELGGIVIEVGQGSGADAGMFGYSSSYGSLVSGDFPGDLFAGGDARAVDAIYEDADANWHFVYGGAETGWAADLDAITLTVTYPDGRDNPEIRVERVRLVDGGLQPDARPAAAVAGLGRQGRGDRHARVHAPRRTDPRGPDAVDGRRRGRAR